MDTTEPKLKLTETLGTDLPPDQELVDEVVEEKQEVTQHPDGKTLINNFKTITKTIKLKPTCTRKHVIPDIEDQLSSCKKKIQELETRWNMVKSEVDIGYRRGWSVRMILEAFVISLLLGIFYNLFTQYFPSRN
jgi:hypothetical protein